MSEIQFKVVEWLDCPEAATEDAATTARLAIYADARCLTSNKSIWAQSAGEDIIVALYPLAMWLASSWWRLSYEPLPALKKGAPFADWRMSHELAAANGGFVWPTMVFATDGEVVQLWAEPSGPAAATSVSYLNGTPGPAHIPLEQFQAALGSLVETVLARLSAAGRGNNGLAALWELVRADRGDPALAQVRQWEAAMGYDPGDCPEALMQHAVQLRGQLGEAGLRELMPIYSERAAGASLREIGPLLKARGLTGLPEVPQGSINLASSGPLPWQRGVDAARQLRSALGLASEPVANKTLFGLLGLTEKAVEGWSPLDGARASVASGKANGRYSYVSRKRHPLAKRFEFARFVADQLRGALADDGVRPPWLIATDLPTYRQKLQRAFAAELLCPIDALVDYLNDDFSETSLENAALHFAVSEVTVDSLLRSNGYLQDRASAAWLPYQWDDPARAA